MGVQQGPLGSCRGCGGCELELVRQEGALALALCPVCGLAQLAGRQTAAGPGCVTPETRPEDVVKAVRTADAADLLHGRTVRHFGGQHGGGWLPMLITLGFTPVFGGTADVVIDCFGSVHDRDQRSALRALADATSPGGVLLLQFRSVADDLRTGRNMLQANHFAYYSLTALVRLLADVGMSPVAAWELELHGGTVLLGAVPAADWPAAAGVGRMLAAEHQMKITTPEAFTG